MNFDDIQNVWNSNADLKNQPDLSEQEIKSLLAKMIEADKMKTRKRMQKQLKAICVMLFLYACFFFFFYGRSTELIVSISALSVLFSVYLRADKSSSAPAVLDSTTATMLSESRVKIKRINNVIKYSLILLIPCILIFTTIINMTLKKEAVSNTVVFYVLFFIFVITLLFRKRITHRFIHTAYSQHISELSKQAVNEVDQ